MTNDELHEIINSLRSIGSDLAFVEAKEAGGGLPKSLRETLSSFSNTPGGGVIILGLAERAGFTATGVKDPARLADELAGMASSEMEPPVRPLIGIHPVDGVSVVTAEVPELSPAEKPCFYKGPA